MLVRKVAPESYPFDLGTPIEKKELTYLWCNDGWCYIPDLQIRQKFILTDSLIELQQEPWQGVIPLPLQTEAVTRVVYCQSPMVWMETSQGVSEIFSEIVPTQSKSKKTRDRQPAQQ